jgi:hypothetical protein
MCHSLQSSLAAGLFGWACAAFMWQRNILIDRTVAIHLVGLVAMQWFEAMVWWEAPVRWPPLSPPTAPPPPCCCCCCCCFTPDEI